MTRQTIGWLVATVTLVALLGSLALTPQFQIWQWTQKYSSIAEAQERLRANPDDVRAHRTLAWRKPYKQARREWEEVMRCDPSDQLAVLCVAPGLIRGDQQDKERAQRLLTPIAAHGNLMLRPEAVHMLSELGVRAP